MKKKKKRAKKLGEEKLLDSRARRPKKKKPLQGKEGLTCDVSVCQKKKLTHTMASLIKLKKKAFKNNSPLPERR